MEIRIRGREPEIETSPDYDRTATHRVTLSNSDIETLLDCLRLAEKENNGLYDGRLYDRLLRVLG